jgi:hypothetical protein
MNLNRYMNYSVVDIHRAILVIIKSRSAAIMTGFLPILSDNTPENKGDSTAPNTIKFANDYSYRFISY